MKLAIFDIDGTLTNTNDVDDVCFVQAFTAAHAIAGINTNWSEYPHTTDSGITQHIFEERFGRAPSSAELFRLQQCFFSLLREQHQASASRFAEIAGASQALSRLERDAGWAVAIATGCWRESAALKLKGAKIEIERLPAAYAEDGLSREEILLAALSKSLSHYAQGTFERIVSVGDGIWDVRAAARLKYAFLGIGSGESEERLRRAGARTIIEDYTDYDRLLRSLHDAETPAPPLHL